MVYRGQQIRVAPGAMRTDGNRAYGIVGFVHGICRCGTAAEVAFEAAFNDGGPVEELLVADLLPNEASADIVCGPSVHVF